jgi:iron complex transport system substrate-binding protein
MSKERYPCHEAVERTLCDSLRERFVTVWIKGIVQMGDIVRKALPFLIAFVLLAKVSYPAGDFPKRIVSLSPNIDEIVYGLGAWKSVVGVTIYSDFPPEVKDLPKVGGWINPNLEAIVALKPDLVIMIKDQDKIFGDKIRRLGLKTLSVNSTTIKDISDSILKVGKALRKDEEAKEVTEKFKSRLDEIRKKTAGVHPKRVLFVVGRNPGTLEDIYVIAKKSYINEIISIAGGENVVKNNVFSVKVSKEAVFSLNPDIIVEVNHEWINKDEAIKVWDGLKGVSAVKNKGVYILTDTTILHPSQRAAEAAKTLAEILHPEIFRKYGKNY